MTPPVGATDSERLLAISYAPAPARAGVAALFALDDRLAQILRTTREPIVGQMRLTWWHEALAALEGAAVPPAEPVLRALAAAVVPIVGGGALAAMTDGWDALLEPALDDAAIDRFATARGGRLFAIAGRVCDVEDPRIGAAGEGWALADLSCRIGDRTLVPAIRRRALARLDDALVGTWPRNARALGALALLARADLRADLHGGVPAAGSPGRIGRILIHRLMGR